VETVSKKAPVESAKTAIFTFHDGTWGFCDWEKSRELFEIYKGRVASVVPISAFTNKELEIIKVCKPEHRTHLLMDFLIVHRGLAKKCFFEKSNKACAKDLYT
jgi:hypothetical protein